MATLRPQPISPALLQQYRLRARRRRPPDGIGGDLTRRKGQSLEFREFTPYTFGDDIRHVDWRASARYGQPHEWLIRRFVAEEQHTVAISIDTRDTMRLPQAMPKLEIACWLAEVVAQIVLTEKNRVILHRLWGTNTRGLREIRGGKKGNIYSIRQMLDSLYQEAEPEEQLNIHLLQPYLPPTSIWVIISDFYFSEHKTLARQIIRNQNGLRQVFLIDLDSWSYEKLWLGTGAREIAGPGLHAERPLFEIDERGLTEVEQAITTHKENFLKLARCPRYDSQWQWTAVEEPDSAKFFTKNFMQDKSIEQLFTRGSQT